MQREVWKTRTVSRVFFVVKHSMPMNKLALASHRRIRCPGSAPSRRAAHDRLRTGLCAEESFFVGTTKTCL